jgi:hypothetical protein
MSCKILMSTTVGWPSTARHAWGFAASGCIVDAVAPAGAPVTQSRHVSKCYRYRSISGLSSLREAIRAAQPDLVVSCDDRAAENLVRLFRLEPKGSSIAKIAERSLGIPKSYPAMVDREGFMRTARSLGIRTPDTLPVPDEAALAENLKEIGLPAVLKADGSWGGDGVAVVRTAEDARAAFRRLAYPPSPLRSVARALRRRDGHWLKAAIAPQRRGISVQRFIHGRSAASGFAAWKGDVVSAVYYDVLVADGALGPPSVIRRVDCPEIAEATRLVARHFGLSGLHGLDFIRDEAGHVHLLEINPRATQGGTLHFGVGRDLAAALTSCLSSRATLRPSIPHDTVVFFPIEWANNPKSTYLENGYHDVPWDDPMILRACLAGVSSPAIVEKFIRESAATEFNAEFNLSRAAAARM